MSAPRDVERNGMAWREAGRGATVALLHGLGGTRTAWEPQLAALSTSYHCAAWDAPGYGAAASLPEVTFPTLADAVARWLDDMEVDHAALVGLSFGGMIAQHAALKHPDRVSALVLADTSPAFGLDGTTVDDWLDARLTAIRAGKRPADIAPDVISAVSGPTLTDDMHAELVMAFSRIEPEPFEQMCHCLITHDTRDRLADIAAPTLVLVGELDAETPLPYARALADGITGARLEVIAGAGHLTPSEQPEAFNPLVRTFLDSHIDQEADAS